MRNLNLLFGLSLALFSNHAVAVDYSSSVQTSAGPLTFYHWFNGESAPKQKWNAPIKSSDPKAFNYISSAGLSRWVVVSTSPVSLRQQGGTSDSWVLIEIKAHPGFKTLELTPDILSSSSCPNLSDKLTTLPPECQKSLEEIVTSLGIDGLKLKSGDIVLTNGKYFQPNDVRAFNRLSSDSPAERLRIQSLFYKADFDRFKIGMSDSLFPAEINRLNPPFSGGGRGLLWDDLDGKPLDLGGEATRELSDQKSP